MRPAQRSPATDGMRRAVSGAVAAGMLAGRHRVGRAVPMAQRVPVLVYHRFGASATDSMTVRIARLEAHLALLARLDCRVVPLADVVAWRLGRIEALPARAVAICADDGHRTQSEVLVPGLRRRGWHVTLFVYPSAISNAAYALTWDQLRALSDAGGCSVQSHTVWHPDFERERARQPRDAFLEFARTQFARSKAILEDRLGRPVSMLAWPFGEVEADLWPIATACGYEAGFALGNRSVARDDPPGALPRHLMVDTVDAPDLERRLRATFGDPLR